MTQPKEDNVKTGQATADREYALYCRYTAYWGREAQPRSEFDMRSWMAGTGRAAQMQRDKYGIDPKAARTCLPGSSKGEKLSCVPGCELGMVCKRLATTALPTTAPLPTTAAERKAIPVGSGFLKYFPDAIAAVAELSRIGNDQHNPGKPLFWDRSKSGDELDALSRHLLEAGTIDTDGVRHSAKVAWRALAMLQKELEAARASKD